jgi:hypothetical protein
MYRAMKPLQFAVLTAVALTGCASAKQPETPCAKLNREVGDNAKAISDVAISRGKTDALNVPFWVPGGTKAVSVITNRQSAKIDKLKVEQATTIAERDQVCRARP